MKNYYTTETYIQKFIKQKYGKKDIPLDELNYRFILDFENFLNDYKPKDHHKPINNNGVMKTYGTFAEDGQFGCYDGLAG
ncbi:phage integrase SAM-like domain-containing protein [Sphingobacterium daejeonense]|uniref:phage integrase SAM-like domain-containing protein n=1 Tax=Sphingobacterium daejeonense TaxID=371142 RepID=UPI001E371949|nr:phage integrase SAM-like domain-containing protein [Sphingobacterium daejeonense]